MLLARAFSPRAAVTGWSQVDDRWYMPNLGIVSDAGIYVTPDTILNCGVVLAAVRFKAEAIAVCRPKVIRVDGEYRYVEPQHPVQRLLRYPNLWQSGYQWSRQMGVWLSIYGCAPNRIIPNDSFFAGELRPLDPSRFRFLEQRPDGLRIFGYRHTDGRPEERLTEDQIHLYEDLSMDAQVPLKTYQLIRNAVGVALAAEQYTGTFLRKGTRLSGVLAVPPGLSKDQRTEISEEWDARRAGSSNAGSVAVLPTTVTFTPISSTNRDSQFVELQDKQIQAILMALGVPGVVVGYSDKASTYASAEAFFASGIRQTLMPTLSSMEERDEMVLMAPFRDSGADYQVKRNMNVFERANVRERFAAYAQATGGASWMAPNEVRALEDANPMEGGDGLVMPLNMSNASAPPEPEDPEPVEREEPEEDEQARRPMRELSALARMAQAAIGERAELERLASVARDLAWRNAVAVVQTEIAAICGKGGARPALGAASKYAADSDGWRAWCEDFYAKHARRVAERLAITEAEAEAYTVRQREALLAGGVAAVIAWEQEVPAQLAALALGRDEQAA